MQLAWEPTQLQAKAQANFSGEVATPSPRFFSSQGLVTSVMGKAEGLCRDWPLPQHTFQEGTAGLFRRMTAWQREARAAPCSKMHNHCRLGHPPQSKPNTHTHLGSVGIAAYHSGLWRLLLAILLFITLHFLGRQRLSHPLGPR